jgi:hypothetical protein
MRLIRSMSAVLALVALGACTTTKPVHDDVLDNRPAYPDAAGLLDTFASEVPATVDGVAVIDMRRMHDYHMVTAFGLLEKDWDSKPMHAEISAVYRDRLGVDLTQADVAFVAFHDDDVYMFMLGNIDGPTGEGVARGDLTVWKAAKEDGIVFVRKKGLDALILTQEGGVERLVAGPRLAGTEHLARMRALVSRVGDADVVVAGSTADLEDPMPDMGMIPGAGMGGEVPEEVGGAAVAISDRFVLAIQGDPAKLTELHRKMDDAISEWREALRKKDEPAANPELEALGYVPPADDDMFSQIGVIWAYHFLGALQNEVAPTLEGDMIVWDLRTDFFTHPVMIGVAVGGVAYVMYTAFLGGFGDGMGAPAMPTGPAGVPTTPALPVAPGGPTSAPASGPTGP